MNSLLFYVSSWSLFFVIGTWLENKYWRKIDPDPKYNYSDTSLAANVINALILIILGTYSCIPLDKIDGPFTVLQREIITSAIAYFAVDSVFLILNRHNRKDVYLHHVGCMIGLGYCVVTDKLGWAAAATCAAGEMGIFLYFDLYAKKWEYQNKSFYFINDTLNLYSFSLSRTVFLGWLLYMVLISEEVTMIGKIIGIAFYSLGAVWTYQLINRYRRKYPESFFGRFVNRLFPLATEDLSTKA